MQGHRFLQPYLTSYEEMPSLIPTGIWRTTTKVAKVSDGREEEVLHYTDYYEITSKGLIEF